MKSIFSILVKLLLVFAVIAGVVWLLQRDSSDDFMVASETTQTSVVMLSTSTVPLQVSGVVEAANEVVVAARTAGTVSRLPVREGGVVLVGDELAYIDAPVAVAQAVYASAARDLSSLSQEEVVALKQLKEAQAAVRQYSAQEIALIRSTTHDHQKAASVDALTNQVRSSLEAMTEVVVYVNDNRSLFTREGLAQYDEIVTELYGSLPDYFKRPGQPYQSVPEGLLVALDAQVVSEKPDIVALQVIARHAESQLNELATLLVTGEDDLFTRGNTYIGDDDITAYLAKRQTVISELSSITTTTARIEAVMDGMLEEQVTLGRDVVVSTLDTELASMQTTYAARIKEQTAVVAAAEAAVANASLSLAKATAPFAGAVTKVYTDVGAYVTPGTPLLSLSGTGAREVTVRVPSAFVVHITPGTPFMVSGEVVGSVARVGAVATGGSSDVVISLYDTDMLVGSSVTGQLELTPEERIFSVPRTYLHFDEQGPFVLDEDGERTFVTVTYDAGSTVYLIPDNTLIAPLVPVSSIQL